MSTEGFQGQKSGMVRSYCYEWPNGRYLGVDNCTAWKGGGCQSSFCPRDNTHGMFWVYDEEELSSEPSQSETEYCLRDDNA